MFMAEVTHSILWFITTSSACFWVMGLKRAKMVRAISALRCTAQLINVHATRYLEGEGTV